MVKQSHDDLVLFVEVDSVAQKFLDKAESLEWAIFSGVGCERDVALAVRLRKAADSMVHVKTTLANLAVESAELSEWLLS